MSDSAPPVDGLMQGEFASRMLEVFRAIDGVLINEHGPRSRLKAPPPFGTPPPQALARYGPGPLFELWLLCNAVERLRIAWTGKPGTPVEAHPDEPDEAPGLEVPKSEGGNYPQERLAATQPEGTGEL